MRALGASEVVVGAMADRPDGLTHAARGARAIYHICPNVSSDEILFGANVIAAALASGVRTVYVSLRASSSRLEAMPHHWNKMRVEVCWFASGLDGTILQPTAYMQNLLASWQAIVDDGVFRRSLSSLRAASAWSISTMWRRLPRGVLD